MSKKTKKYEVHWVYFKQDFSNKIFIENLDDIWNLIRKDWWNALKDGDVFYVGFVKYYYDKDRDVFLLE
jgi:hypothetical protein